MVWYGGNEIINQCQIERIYWDKDLNDYRVNILNRDEKDCWGRLSCGQSRIFSTKNELIEARIHYWKNQLMEELEQDISPYCSPPFEGEIKGFAASGLNIEPRLDRVTGPLTNPFLPNFEVKANINSNQHQDDIDGCQHKQGDISEMVHKCVKCGALYR